MLWGMRASLLDIPAVDRSGGARRGADGLPAAAGSGAAHRPFDLLLDSYVRDGIIFYRALRLDRAKLDHYVASLDSQAVISGLPTWDKPRQIAFWINAYNALALQTGVNHYPAGIHQVPGAFDQLKHNVAGKSVTLDQIENTILAAYNDPRIYLVLGRSAMGSGRLRSEVVQRCPARGAAGPVRRAVRHETGTCPHRSAGRHAQRQPDFQLARQSHLSTPTQTSPWISPAAPHRAGHRRLPEAVSPEVRARLPGEKHLEARLLDFDWKLNDRAGIRH